MDRIELRILEKHGCMLCDLKRWEKAENSMLSRFYLSVFHNHKSKKHFDIKEEGCIGQLLVRLFRWQFKGV